MPETNQKGSRSLGLLQRAALRCTPRTGDIGKSRGLCPVFWGAPPSRLSVLCCAARLREMAVKAFLLQEAPKNLLGVLVKYLKK
jgi:hypothetical protein